MPAVTFLFYLITAATRRVLAGHGGIAMAREPDATEVGIFLRTNHKSLDLKANTNIGKPGGLLWLCPQEDFSAVTATTKPADRGRDCLGLIHHPQDKALIALYFAANDLAATAGKRPTFADAGGHSRFRTRADQRRHREQSTWGFTVDLEPFARGVSDTDGLPERICLPVSSNDISTVDILALGRTTLSRGNSPGDDDSAFSDRICTRHGDTARLRDEIIGIL
jgi:hypothetical protein